MKFSSGSFLWICAVVLAGVGSTLAGVAVKREQTRVDELKASIAQDREAIRVLQGELAARSSLASLEKMSVGRFSLSTPSQAQYFEGVTRLVEFVGTPDQVFGAAGVDVQTSALDQHEAAGQTGQRAEAAPKLIAAGVPQSPDELTEPIQPLDRPAPAAQPPATQPPAASIGRLDAAAIARLRMASFTVAPDSGGTQD